MPDQQIKCQDNGCSNPGEPCWLPDDDCDEQPSHFYCSDHKFQHGFCVMCGNFYGGVECFDFGDGYCDDCNHTLFGREDAWQEDEYESDYDPEEDMYCLDEETYA